ncbi:hypothetical protein PG990_000090 [Apiospora arundinis]
MNNVDGWMAIIMIAMVWMVVAVGEKLLIWGNKAWVWEVEHRAALRARGLDHLDDVVRFVGLRSLPDAREAFGLNEEWEMPCYHRQWLLCLGWLPLWLRDIL